MADTWDAKQRSARMKLIRGRDTAPEMMVRKLLRGLGYRCRFNDRKLPGKPDIACPLRRKVVFVHGCFWHRHRAKSCRLARLPKSRLDFWEPKLEANRLRDRRTRAALSRIGWKSMIVWECQLGDTERIKNKLVRFLEAA